MCLFPINAHPTRYVLQSSNLSWIRESSVAALPRMFLAWVMPAGARFRETRQNTKAFFFAIHSDNNNLWQLRVRASFVLLSSSMHCFHLCYQFLSLHLNSSFLAVAHCIFLLKMNPTNVFSLLGDIVACWIQGFCAQILWAQGDHPLMKRVSRI